MKLISKFLLGSFILGFSVSSFAGAGCWKKVTCGKKQIVCYRSDCRIPEGDCCKVAADTTGSLKIPGVKVQSNEPSEKELKFTPIEK